jgi:uncharacterized RDD family membrane protein YckC
MLNGPNLCAFASLREIFPLPNSWTPSLLSAIWYSRSARPMTWYYLIGSQPNGPVEETEIDHLYNVGTITLGTRVWRQGLQTWKPLAEAFNRPAVNCFRCKRLYSPDLSVRYGSLSVCQDCKEIFFQQIREGLSPETAGIYGGFWIRAGAYMIDQIALFLVRLPFELALRAFVFWQMFQGSGNTPTPFWQLRGVLIAYGLYFIFILALHTAYYVFFVGRYGATPGKMALKLQIVRSDLSKVTYLRALGRYFAQALSGSLTLYIGYIMAGFDSEKRALHDYICDTRVIKRPSSVPSHK